MKPSDISMLVVDDEQMILETISALFSGFGFYVDCASSGNIAWEMVVKNKSEVVPDHYIENELKEYLNREYQIDPKIPLK